MENTSEALANYKHTLDHFFEEEKENEWNNYKENIDSKISKFDKRTAKKVSRDSENFGKKTSLKRKIGNGLAGLMFLTSGYIVTNVPIASYEVQPGDGFSNVAYELNMPNSDIERLQESYIEAFGTETLHPNRTANKYLFPKRVNWK